MGEYDLYIEDLTEAIRLDSYPCITTEEAYYNCGLAYQKKSDLAKAESDFAKARQLRDEPE